MLEFVQISTYYWEEENLNNWAFRVQSEPSRIPQWLKRIIEPSIDSNIHLLIIYMSHTVPGAHSAPCMMHLQPDVRLKSGVSLVSGYWSTQCNNYEKNRLYVPTTYNTLIQNNFCVGEYDMKQNRYNNNKFALDQDLYMYVVRKCCS